MSIFNERKRRNVFKVAAAYIIVVWLLLQVSDTLVPALHLPDWFHSGVATRTNDVIRTEMGGLVQERVLGNIEDIDAPLSPESRHPQKAGLFRVLNSLSKSNRTCAGIKPVSSGRGATAGAASVNY